MDVDNLKEMAGKFFKGCGCLTVGINGGDCTTDRTGGEERLCHRERAARR